MGNCTWVINEKWTCDTETKQNIVIQAGKGYSHAYPICLAHTKEALDDYGGQRDVIILNEVHLRMLIDDTPITITKGDLYQALCESSECWVKSFVMVDIDVTKVSSELSNHLFGNVTMALQHAERKRAKVQANTACDSCIERFEIDGLDTEDLTTGELAQITKDAGYMVPDHDCDNLSQCVCSGHK